jgi:hypothetical protein
MEEESEKGKIQAKVKTQNGVMEKSNSFNRIDPREDPHEEGGAAYPGKD